MLRLDRPFGRGGNGARTLGTGGDRRRADDGAERRRSHAHDRFRLSAGARLRRYDAEADGDRDHLLRSHDRRRHRRADAPQHQGRVHRVAGLGDARGAGHSRDRRGRARARRLRHHGQHLGDAALLLAARAWRRYGGRSRHQISLRPRRPSARPRLGQCGMVRAASSMRPSHGHSSKPRGCVSRASRPAHHGAQAARGGASGAGAGAMAQRPSRGLARHSPCLARSSRPRALEARLYRLVGPLFDRAEAGVGRRRRRLPRWPRAVRTRLFLGRLRKPRPSLRLHAHPHRDALRRPAARRCASASASRISRTSRRTSTGASRD